MTKKELQKEWQWEPVTGTKRRSKGHSLLRQLVERKQMVAVRDKEGKLCTGTNGGGQALEDFWQEIMVSPPEGTEKCTEYLETCNPPGYWRTSLPPLWKEPDIDTVMNALDSLDGTSAPGTDASQPSSTKRLQHTSPQGCCRLYTASTTRGCSRRSGQWAS